MTGARISNCDSPAIAGPASSCFVFSTSTGAKYQVLVPLEPDAVIAADCRKAVRPNVLEPHSIAAGQQNPIISGEDSLLEENGCRDDRESLPLSTPYLEQLDRYAVQISKVGHVQTLVDA